jgi:hypothetical protein
VERGRVVAVTDPHSPDLQAPDLRTPDPEPTEDLEYDLAHEADVHQVPSVATAEPVYVPTQTVDYDGDYGYDLAHDVPGR